MSDRTTEIIGSMVAGVGTVAFLSLMSSLTQAGGRKEGCLWTVIPCGLFSVAGVYRAVTEPEWRILRLVGAGLSGAGAFIGATPYYVDDEKAKDKDIITSTSITSAVLGTVGGAIVLPDLKVELRNPVNATAELVGVSTDNPLRR